MMPEHRTLRPKVAPALVELEETVKRVVPALQAKIRRGVIEMTPAGERVRLRTHRRAVVTPSVAARLVREHEPDKGLVVADMVHSSAAALLGEAGWSFWDRRGRLLIQHDKPYVSVDRPTASFVTGADGPEGLRPITGSSGLAVALATLLEPDDPPGVREIARLAGMAPSTISRSRSRLVDHHLLDENGAPLLPELFWATSDAWVPRWHPVTSVPAGESWLVSGDAAAAEWGAPTVGGRAMLYGLDPGEVTRHRLRHGAEDDREVRCQVALVPTTVIRAVPAGCPASSAPVQVVPPVVAALDLSRDARGREILDEWSAVTAPAGRETEPPRAVWR